MNTIIDMNDSDFISFASQNPVEATKKLAWLLELSALANRQDNIEKIKRLISLIPVKPPPK
jgi:hypothetical protein